MRLTQLQYFDEICRNNCNMTKAAGTLHVSQPALSRAIRDLEDELGVLLFRRVKQRIELTTDGIYLKDRVSSILRQVDELPALMRRQRDNQLLLGVHPSLSWFVFDFLNDFSSVYPDITVLMSNAYEKRNQLIQSVLEGKMDAALVVYNLNKNYPDESLLKILDLKKTRVVYVVGEKHPLAGRSMVSYRDIAIYPLYGHVTKAEKRIRELGLQAKMLMNTHDLRMIGKMLGQQYGGALLLYEFACAIPGSVIIELEDNIPVGISLVSRRETALSKTQVLDCFLSYAEKNRTQMMYLFE